MEPKEQSPASKPSSASKPHSSGPNLKPGLLKKLLLVIAAIFIVLIGIVALTRTTNKTGNQQISAETAKVSITKKGLVPAVIRVDANTTIIWTNQDSKVHQVAADPYPRNDSIPGMDSSVILNKGDSFSFNFAESGIYTYHDQRHPLAKIFQGTVIVD